LEVEGGDKKINGGGGYPKLSLEKGVLKGYVLNVVNCGVVNMSTR